MASFRPVMRWHGGKWRLAPWIIQHFPDHRVYVEGYGGAASVLMRKHRSYVEVYNDLNGDAANVFRVLRDRESAAELERLLRLTPFAREEFETPINGADSVERARRMIFRSFAGFSSASANAEYPTGFRANSNRSGTTPAYDWMHYPDEIARFVERLSGVVIEQRPAIDVMRQHDSLGTLHYVDPPYPRSVRRPRNSAIKEYGELEMTDMQHEELAGVLHSLAGHVVVSGYRCDLYDELYSDWSREDRSTYADGARLRTECLWLKPGSTISPRMGFALS